MTMMTTNMTKTNNLTTKSVEERIEESNTNRRDDCIMMMIDDEYIQTIILQDFIGFVEKQNDASTLNGYCKSDIDYFHPLNFKIRNESQVTDKLRERIDMHYTELKYKMSLLQIKYVTRQIYFGCNHPSGINIKMTIAWK
jgi:hypothetical protein